MGVDAGKTFYTATMARLLCNQGKYGEASRIYRYLLDQEPDRTDIRQALEEISDQLPDLPQHWDRISSFLEQWARLVIRQQTLFRVRQLRIKKE